MKLKKSLQSSVQTFLRSNWGEFHANEIESADTIDETDDNWSELHVIDWKSIAIMASVFRRPSIDLRLQVCLVCIAFDLSTNVIDRLFIGSIDRVCDKRHAKGDGVRWGTCGHNRGNAEVLEMVAGRQSARTRYTYINHFAH
jgi:hypothetical protein